MKKIIIGIGALLFVAVGVLVFVYKPNLERIELTATLFSGAEQYQNFSRIRELFPTTILTASSKPYDFPQGEAVLLPENYDFNGDTLSVNDFLTLTDTSALLVLEDGKVRFEEYYLTGGRDVNWWSMSVSKSFVSTLVGIALQEGHIESVDVPITKYVPELKGSAYDGVAIVDVLEMSSGAAWNEDYADPESDVMKMGRIMGMGDSLDELTATLQPERPPGTFNQYTSADTQALAMLLARATGRSITDYMQEKLWEPLGAESDAYWIVDDYQVEMAFGGLNATARDYAKIGELFRRNGEWQGTQIINPDWVYAATHAEKPHLVPGENLASDYPMGYGYQWWLMDGVEEEYSAIGVYNQFTYVNPTRDLVIVKLSAFSDYAKTEDEAGYREFETIALFRAIGQSLARSEQNREQNRE
ncbi:MAG: CubicO group peptidase (beta-lactamase class C family) [Candidatus Azotimanducaceae bacterium]|jgi:CubicO group peptidase (beta-lactamase class C family)